MMPINRVGDSHSFVDVLGSKPYAAVTGAIAAVLLLAITINSVIVYAVSTMSSSDANVLGCVLVLAVNVLHFFVAIIAGLHLLKRIKQSWLLLIYIVATILINGIAAFAGLIGVFVAGPPLNWK